MERIDLAMATVRIPHEAITVTDKIKQEMGKLAISLNRHVASSHASMMVGQVHILL